MTYPTDPRHTLEPPGPERPSEPPAPAVRQPWPPVCAVIIGGSVALYVLDAFLRQGDFLGGGLGPVFQWIALYGPLVQEAQPWRVFSFIFSHGGPIHLFFNMWMAYSLGVPLERGIGSGRFLLLSLTATLGSAAFALLFNFDVPTVGASGLILGWGGAMFMTAGKELRRSLLFWLAQVAVISLLPGVSWAGHLGGFLFGVPMGLALRAGPHVYARAAPLLLAIAAGVTYLTAHPELLRGSP